MYKEDGYALGFGCLVVTALLLAPAIAIGSLVGVVLLMLRLFGVV